MSTSMTMDTGSTKGTLVLTVLKKRDGFLLIHSANPAQGASSSPLRDSALTYTQYRPRRLTFRYTPTVSALKMGSLVWAALRTEDAEFDFDTTADQGKLFLAMASSAGSVTWRMSEPRTWRVPVGNFPTSWFYMDADKDNSVPFMVYCALDDSSDVEDGSTIGRISLEYSYDFQGKRKVPANAVSMDDTYGNITVSGVPSSYRDGLFNLHITDKIGGLLKDGMRVISKAVAKAGEDILSTGLAAGKQALLSRLGYASRLAYGYGVDVPEVYEVIVDGSAVSAAAEGSVTGDYIVPYIGTGVTGDGLTLMGEVNELDERVAVIETALPDKSVNGYCMVAVPPTYSMSLPVTMTSGGGTLKVIEVDCRLAVAPGSTVTDTVGDYGVSFTGVNAVLSFGAGGTFVAARLRVMYRTDTSTVYLVVECGPKVTAFTVQAGANVSVANDHRTASMNFVVKGVTALEATF